MKPRTWLLISTLIVAGILAYLGWMFSRPQKLPIGFATSNGRIEAVEIDVATKTPGRLVAVHVDEGDFVAAGLDLAQMDTEVLQAQLREAEAELRRSKTTVVAALSNVSQRESEKAASESTVAQREAEFNRESKSFERAKQLATKSIITEEDLDGHRASFFGTKAAVESSKANVAAAEAAISTARSLVIVSEASVDASQAKVERLLSDIKECTLKSPRDGRVQYRVSQPGEVLNAGGKVLNMVDLGDVYMTFFLPTAEAGRVQMGAEARVVLDAAPQYVIPASVSFVADVAQFTPKSVETAEERQKLMFRIKARIDPDVLKKYIRTAKTGLPGMAYVRLNDQSKWPARLEVRLPQ